MSTPSMAIETTRELFDILVGQGIDQDLLLRKSGIDLQHLQQAECRFPVREHLRLWQAAEEIRQQDALGLRMGALSNPYNRGIVGLVFQTSPDLESAVLNKVRYTKILADHIALDFDASTEDFSVTYSILDNCFHRSEIERVFAGFLNWVRVFVDQKVIPERLSFQYAKPACVDIYQRYFQCPLFFDQPRNEILLPQALLKTRNPNYNDYLHGILRMRAESVLGELDRKTDLISDVRNAMAARLCKGQFSAQEIAEAHCMSVRTLHRRLGEKGLTYQDLLDDVRKEMALSHLSTADCCQKALYALVGYSDSRAFLRAFRRWTGTSPKLYMAAQAQRSPQAQHTL